MLRGLFYSLILHILIILLIAYVIPGFFTKNKRDMDISVDIIALDELIPPPPVVKKIEKKQKTSKKKVVKKETKKITDDDKIRKYVAKPKPIVKKKPQPIDTQKKKAKSSKKVKKTVPSKKSNIAKKIIIEEGQEDLDYELAQVLKEIKRVQREERENLYREKYIYGSGLNPRERYNIKKQINSCWNNVVSKVFSEEEMVDIKVKVLVSLDEDGHVLSTQLADSSMRYMQMDNTLYRKIADSALSTFYRCRKIYNLPQDKYEYWKEFEFTFDPNDLEIR